MQPTLLVLAAGMGSRYGGLKQLDAMGPHGETVLDYSVFDAIRAGFGRVVFIIREDFAAEFRARVGSRFADRIQVDYAFQRLDDLPDGCSVPTGRAKPWGTAHAVRAARDLVREPFAVINADDFYGRDAYQVVATYFGHVPLGGDPVDHYAMVGYALSALLMGGAVALIVALISTVIGKGFVMTFVNFWGPTSFVAAYFTYYGLTAL